MSNSILVPAAQYLRMSTEHQQYSMANQAAAVEQYAEAHGFQIIQTYSDEGRSGLVLRHRTGLQKLLADVVAGNPGYKAILVYDVSRWGRFQDSDEAAHYEYLCKAAGIPVHYCAECFSNDSGMVGLMMKALKRTMAGEFSRELSQKTLLGQKRLSSLGYRMGAYPGYGFRRMLYSDSGQGKQLLRDYEHKNIATDRVKLVPGPDEEVAIVRDIFRMYVDANKSPRSIAQELNRRGIQLPGTHSWSEARVYKMLQNPKYAGSLVYGRTSQRLAAPKRQVPREEWVVVAGAYQPLIAQDLFSATQEAIKNRIVHRSEQQLLEELRRLWREKGRLTGRMINACPYTAAASTYYLRFGTLQHAYQLIGYRSRRDCSLMAQHRAANWKLRQNLLEQIVTLFPDDICLVPGKRRGYRARLKVQGRNLCVLIARSTHLRHGEQRWTFTPLPKEARYLSLLVRLNSSNDGIFDLHLFRSIQGYAMCFLKEKDPRLRQGTRLRSLKQLLIAVERLRCNDC